MEFGSKRPEGTLCKHVTEMNRLYPLFSRTKTWNLTEIFELFL
jgi:hypothetical protein